MKHSQKIAKSKAMNDYIRKKQELCRPLTRISPVSKVHIDEVESKTFNSCVVL